jgi:hypothetical protein
MPRPCHNSHPLSPEKCRLCFWVMSPTAKGAARRKLWSEPDPPTLGQMAVNYAGAAAGHLLGGLRMADDALIARRLEICAACPELVVREKGNSCRKCGCGLAAKCAWASSACPLGKW